MFTPDTCAGFVTLPNLFGDLEAANFGVVDMYSGAKSKLT